MGTYINPDGGNGLTVWGNASIPITTNFNFADYPNGAVLLIDTTTVGPISGQLPAPVRGLLWTVKGIVSGLATNPLTVVRFGAEKIAGVAANFRFAENLGEITLVCDGTDWWLLSPTYQQPYSSPQGAGYAILASDIGNVIFATGAGAQAFTLASMAGSLMTSRMLLLTIVCTNAATAVTITPGATSQINNAGVGVAYVAPPGATISLKSLDGLSWVAR